MHIMYFTERPYRYVPNDEVIKNGYFGIPNKHFDSVKGGQLLNEYLDEKVLAEELGFDGVMLNEHHDTSFCMGSVMNVEASILARITKKVKIVLLGNPLPVVGNPLRLAEELGDDRHDLGRAAGHRMGARRRQRAVRHQREPGLQSRVLQRSARCRDPGVDQARPVSLRGQAFPLPLYRSVVPADSEAASADLDSRTAEPRDRDLVREASLSVHRAGDLPGADGRACGTSIAMRRRKRATRSGRRISAICRRFTSPRPKRRRDEIAKWDMFGGAGIGYSLFGQPQWMFPPGYNSKDATKRMARQFTDPLDTDRAVLGGTAAQTAR